MSTDVPLMCQTDTSDFILIFTIIPNSKSKFEKVLFPPFLLHFHIDFEKHVFPTRQFRFFSITLGHERG